jgi:hypothetical protein
MEGVSSCVAARSSFHSTSSCFSRFSTALVVLLACEIFFVSFACLPQGITLEYWPNQLYSV